MSSERVTFYITLRKNFKRKRQRRQIMRKNLTCFCNTFETSLFTILLNQATTTYEKYCFGQRGVLLNLVRFSIIILVVLGCFAIIWLVLGGSLIFGSFWVVSLRFGSFWLVLASSCFSITLIK